MGDGVLEAEVGRRVAVLAAEDLVRVAGDELDRRGGQADLEAVEVGEQVAVAVVDAPVRLVGDDQVEEAHVEALEALHHRRVGGEVDPLVAVLRGGRGDDRSAARPAGTP